jgi:mRNA interferase MazF
MVRGDIYLTRFPMGGTVGAKNRPALLLTGPVGSVPEYVTAYLSSVIPGALLPSDLLLDPSQPEHASTNLKQRSATRLHKLATVHQRDLFRKLGELSPTAMALVEGKLRGLLSL